MLRKLAVFIVSAGLTMSPLSVQALGFGAIKLKSSLNEKLNAEVTLLSASTNDVQSLTISLATEEAFLRSGIDRTALFNKLKFKVKQRVNGDYYIHVTTTETVREPFMNFLLEMNWKNGRMLREYTMLIDPPGRAPKLAEPGPVIAETIVPELESSVAEEFIEPAAPPVFEMPESAEAVIEAEPVPAVDATAEMIAAEEIEREIGGDEAFAGDKLWPRIPLTAYSESDNVYDDSADTVVVDGEMGDLDYGITKADDNLWNIAEKLRQGDESISVYQVMMALLQSNPDAFINNNVHRLKVGHVLRIDDPSVLTSLTRKEAANSFVEQTDAWNSYRRQVAKTTGVQPIMAGGNAAGKGVVATDTTGELTLSSPDGESLTAGGGAKEESLSNDLATMQEQLRQAKSDAGTMRTRNVALNDKLQSLEDELNRLQRSLSVKDDELAALQQRLSSLNQQPVKAPVVEKQPVAKVIKKPVARQEKNKANANAEQDIMDTAMDAVQGMMDTAMDATQGMMDTVMDAVQGITDAAAPIVASATKIVTELNLGNNSDTLLFIGAPIALVLLIIIVVVIKRRRQGGNFPESILTGAASADAGGAPGGNSTEESSFLSDFAMSGASAIEADDSEVDPLTEADVFMAYGRYEAAEERLNEAVQNEPNRLELHAKLLEVYHATQNKAAFESSAEDFYARLGGNAAENPLWGRVVSMGSEIAPENPLFNQGGAGTSMFATDTPASDDFGMSMTDNEVMDIGLETGVFTAADLSGSPETSSDDMDFNFDLGESTDLDESTAAAEPADMDFNLDMGTTDSAEDAGLDFNLDMGTGDIAVEEESAADLDFSLDMATTDSTGDGGLDFNLDIGGVETETTNMGLDFDTSSSASDEGSLDLNLDASDTADVDIGGGDEVGTKLDLAKAYIDMGDPDGARSILDEVMDEGNSTQKEDAQSLLGQIA